MSVHIGLIMTPTCGYCSLIAPYRFWAYALYFSSSWMVEVLWPSQLVLKVMLNQCGCLPILNRDHDLAWYAVFKFRVKNELMPVTLNLVEICFFKDFIARILVSHANSIRVGHFPKRNYKKVYFTVQWNVWRH